MVDRASLQKYSLFGALMPEEIERIVPLLGSESYGAGDVIIGEGDLNGCIRFVLEGRVEVSRDGIRLNEIGEGDTFGEMEILDVMKMSEGDKVASLGLVPDEQDPVDRKSVV